MTQSGDPFYRLRHVQTRRSHFVFRTFFGSLAVFMMDLESGENYHVVSQPGHGAEAEEEGPTSKGMDL